MTIRQKAVNRAILLLKSAGADFCVKFDGQIYGQLKVLDEPFMPKKFVDPFRHIYIEGVTNLKSGQSCKWLIGNELAGRLRGAITGHCNKIWGRQTYMSTITKRSATMSEVELLRL